MTAPVEKRTLDSDVTEVQGRYSAGSTLAVPAPALDVPAVVTRQVLRKGETVQSGSVLAEVSGRPVIGLATPFRLYRDLAPGDEGPDVAALQDALRALDLYQGRSDGAYGAGTAGAVKALYSNRGYSVPVDDELVEAVEQAETMLEETLAARPPVVSSTQDDALSDEGQSGAGVSADESMGPDAVDRSAVAAVENSIAEARAELDEARFDALTPFRVAEIVRLPDVAVKVVSAAQVGAELGGGGVTGGESESDDGAASTVEPVGGGDLGTLRVGRPSLVLRVPMASKDGFPAGGEVEVRAITDQSTVVRGVVRQVSEFRQPDAGTPGGLPGYDVTVVFEGTPEFTDGDTLVASGLEAVAPKADGLSVPVVALREDPDGAYVTVVGRGKVAVTVKATGDGYAVVEAEGLSVGDRVVVSGGADTTGAEGGQPVTGSGS
ncbi:putative peptidoglycan binding domain-containing protein [Promicromonospora umidemergens]|uniref:Peptidoglycan binding-like domain-containing protein n=1 Tax=Promicromonospora umidemergens TaxID=629679 RepID=A0ABP8XJ93_9MICO|nr:putative peptidoglycan binding domain-containing protein [Promicromonospora umidemergens]